MKRIKSILAGCFLVAATAMVGAGTAVAAVAGAWSPELKVQYINGGTSYAWVYGVEQNTVLDTNRYYYCRIYDADLRDQLSDALANNITIKMYCLDGWDTDNSRVCKTNNYVCGNVLSYRSR